ncbi:unnamed protein product [Medioppia subpectinata]|uniref:C2H2-type domain-containing protein n=1 Tax=Medioppia subpectinata TaxID=1979941 RepID=A0A7R9KIT0_9ACAR|nr:unnamed protein product [Medioppia subpectinata]CAG2104450.1 unnamed protein product [Medioppia subpectinata]
MKTHEITYYVLSAAPVDTSVALVINDNPIDGTHEDITKKCSNVFRITRDSTPCLPTTQTQDTSGLYPCSLKHSCNQWFKTQEEYKNHCIVSHKNYIISQNLVLTANGLVSHKTDGNNTSNEANVAFRMRCLTEDCEQVFTAKTAVIYHLINDHLKTTIFVCEMFGCDELYVTYEEFLEHRLEVHNIKTQIRCGNREHWMKKTNQLVNRYIDKERGVKPYLCAHEGCGKRFARNDSLRNHTECHTVVDRRFKCDVCGKLFKRADTLNTHVIRIHEYIGQPATCAEPGCGRTFKSNLSLRAHIKRIHSGREYRCDWPDCGYRGRHEQAFRDHVRRHTNDKPFACRAPGCEYRTHSKPLLWYHNRSKHTTDKPFTCDWPACEYRCKYKVLLRQHVRIHTRTHSNDKQYACDWPACDYKCRYKPNLYLHQKSTHISDKLYECDWPACKYNTYFKANLSQHRSTHSNDKPVVCHWPGCEQRFKNNMSLNGHMYVHREPHLRMHCLCAHIWCTHGSGHTIRVTRRPPLRRIVLQSTLFGTVLRLPYGGLYFVLRYGFGDENILFIHNMF